MANIQHGWCLIYLKGCFYHSLFMLVFYFSPICLFEVEVPILILILIWGGVSEFFVLVLVCLCQSRVNSEAIICSFFTLCFDYIWFYIIWGDLSGFCVFPLCPSRINTKAIACIFFAQCFYFMWFYIAWAYISGCFSLCAEL